MAKTNNVSKDNKGKDNKGKDAKEVSKNEKKVEKTPYQPDKKAKAGSEGIVRIVDTDVSASLPISRCLSEIKGVGVRYNTLAAKVFETKTKVAYNTPIGKLNEEQIQLFEDIVKNPTKYDVPKWFVNKPVDIWDGKTKHLLGSELMFSDKEELDRLGKVKHRKALRRVRGLPVRGQRTKSGFRHRRKSVGVVKK